MDKNIPTIERASNEIDFINRRSNETVKLYNICLFGTILTFLSLPFFKIDITTRAPAIVQSSISKEDVYAPTSGIINNLIFKDNRAVKKGEILFSVDGTTLKKQIHLSVERQATLEEKLHDIKELLLNSGTRTPNLQSTQYKSEYYTLTEQLTDAQNNIDHVSNNYERHAKLFSNKAISLSEWEDKVLELKRAKSTHELILKKFYMQLQSEETQIKNELYTNKKELYQNNEIQNRNIVKANIDGTINKAIQIQNGSYIQSGQKIGEINPDSSLIAVCYISPRDIGFISIGQPTNLQITSFNYTEWGTLMANVIEISNDVIMMEDKSLAFKVKVKFTKKYLQLKNGYKGHITKGMTANASFFITRRSMWQLLYDKLNNWLDPKSPNQKTNEH